MIEAMICGRMPIVTDVGRVRELVDDNRSGFIAAGPTAEMLDEALERAWNLRHEWQAMGAEARTAIKTRHSMRPAEDFANSLADLSERANYPGRHSPNSERAELRET
jgi:glycosyltransferase involved in cell wall biosynthesis